MSRSFDITIVTINYNNAAGLKRTLESVADQTYPNLQHVVFDGRSADSSVDMIRNYGQHVKEWKSEVNGGIYYNQNRGFEMAKGEYSLFLNSGDYLYEPTGIAQMVNHISTDAEIYYGDLWLENNDKLSLKQYPSMLPSDYFLYETLPHPATLIKNTVLRKFLGYDEGLKICSDWKFFLQAYSNNRIRFSHVPYAPSVFGLDGVSSSANNRGRILNEQITVLKENFPELLPLFMQYHGLIENKPSRLNSIKSRLRSWIKSS